VIIANASAASSDSAACRMSRSEASTPPAIASERSRSQRSAIAGSATSTEKLVPFECVRSWPSTVR
jgi:hypothetical protein